MKKLLLVEDNPQLLRAMEIYFTGLGFEVSCHSDTEGIIEDFGSIQPDLGVFDVWVDPIAGDELCQLIKHELVGPDFPIVLISAKGDLRERAKEVEADDFIEKPFRLTDLGQAVMDLAFPE
jgi:DNA-binding response OmpR family regulator